MGGGQPIWHCTAYSTERLLYRAFYNKWLFCPLKGHPKRHLVAYCPIEGHCVGQFSVLCSLDGHLRGHFTMFCHLEGQIKGTSLHLISYKKNTSKKKHFLNIPRTTQMPSGRAEASYAPEEQSHKSRRERTIKTGFQDC